MILSKYILAIFACFAVNRFFVAFAAFVVYIGLMNQAAHNLDERVKNGALAALSAGQSIAVAGLGCSMGPRFQQAEQVILSPLHHPPRLGEVVVFSRNEQWVAHRIIAIKHQGQVLITKGDGYARLDDPVQADQVIGIVTAIQERNGSTPTPLKRFSLYTLRQLLRGWCLHSTQTLSQT
jgi:signal peptidase I